MNVSITRPASVSDQRITWLGLASMLAMTAVVVRNEWPTHHAAVALMVAAAAPIVLLEVMVLKVHRRVTTGLDWQRWDFDPGRLVTRLLGLAATVGAVLSMYGLMVEYHAQFYDAWYALLWAYGPPALVFSFLWVALTDSRMVDPHDGLWNIGRIVTLRWRGVDGSRVADHARTWVIKGFFTPLMLVYLARNIAELRRLVGAETPFLSGMHWFDILWSGGFLVDVTFTTMGYILTMRALDTHVRSAQPTTTGWVVALCCYEPFFSLMSRQYLVYSNGQFWGDWLAPWPVVKALWGMVLLALLAVFFLSTVAFGCRFSNLTHRGIVTNGMYRFTKHPAYLSKIASFWMIFIPFVYRDSGYEVVRDCFWLAALSGIYFLRARTEEQHLSSDPDYVRYALWIDEHGWFAAFGRWFPFLRYRPPA